MSKFLKIKNKIKPFKKEITIEGDKSISIRWALLASQSKEKSVATNILRSEDVLSTLNCLKKLGIKVKLTKKKCEIKGRGLNGFKSKDLILNAGNSGTFGRLILGLLTHTKFKTKIIGDKSLSKRDFTRVVDPLKKFGASFVSKSGKLPITIIGTDNPKAIKHVETKGSAQVKSSIMLAALNTKGTTTIKAKKSRNHTELFFKYLNIPIRIKKERKYDLIEVNGLHQYNSFNYTIPGDISSSAFFIVLTISSKNSKIKIKNINVNKSRIGIITILRKMNCNIILQNKKIYKGEKTADIIVKSTKKIKAINCPSSLNSSAIDEFLIIFLIAAKANGISSFKNLGELNKKESPRLNIVVNFLKMIGIKVKRKKDNIKIYGNPNLELDKDLYIKNYLKDHRIFMMSCIAALSFGGKWKIDDKDSFKTSFPIFLKVLKSLGAKLS